jgi:hypothetical protein
MTACKDRRVGVEHTMPDRRAVLSLAATGALTGLLAGCQGSGGSPGTPSAPQTSHPPREDLLARDRTAARTRALLTGSRAGPRRLRSLLARISADHVGHLAALGAAPAPTPSGADPGAPAADAAGLADGEWSAASQELAELVPLGPGMAALLARIAASRAVHADLIADLGGLARRGTVLRPAQATGAGPSASSSPRPPRRADLDAIARLLAGEHAAVFAYGMVVARSKRTLADRLWSEHVAARDALERALDAAGLTPQPAAAAYDLGPAPASPSAARALAVRVEQRLAVLANAAVAGTRADSRVLATQHLVAAARRLASWRRVPAAFPGGS